MTTLLFISIGISFILSERTLVGALLFGLGTLRGAAAVRQWRDAFSE